MNLIILNRNINFFVFFVKIAENASNPAKFEVRIYNTSIFVAEKSVNIEAMIVLFSNHSLNPLLLLKFS